MEPRGISHKGTEQRRNRPLAADANRPRHLHLPFVRLADLPQRLSCTYPTARSDITRLLAAGILSEVPNIRPKTYFAPAIFEIAYERLTEQDS